MTWRPYPYTAAKKRGKAKDLLSSFVCGSKMSLISQMAPEHIK